MLPSHHWARNFAVEDDEIEFLINYLLEKETPLSTHILAYVLVENRLNAEAAALQEEYKDVRVYNPADSYDIGQKLVFPFFNYATAVVTDTRDGNNEDYGTFRVATVTFEDGDTPREFAMELQTSHSLIAEADNGEGLLFGQSDLTADDIMQVVGDDIIASLEEMLQSHDNLAYVARKWFPQDLMLEVNEGHLNLAEAVLDINGGGPLSTESIIEQIGGLGQSPMSLQIFSLNYVLNNDKRFDEVGPTGEVLWYLARMEPNDVQKMPSLLHHSPIQYDRSLLNETMQALEFDICDELSPIEPMGPMTRATTAIIYPHRRAGTLPLNAKNRHIFPNAERTSRIWITLVDKEDGEEYTGWVIPDGKYVSGLGPIYRKYSLPIGGYVTISRGDEAGKIVLDFSSYRARTEWIRLLTPKGDQIQFENTKRAIGVDYDDLLILGVDDLEALDAVYNTVQRQQRSLAALMRMLLPELSRLSPQGAAHIKTLYSAVNVFRRCPPGPIIATLVANPDFESVGGEYWRLAES